MKTRNRPKPSSDKLRAMAKAFTPLTIATAVPLELPPLIVIGRPAKLPNAPVQPLDDDVKIAA